MKLEKVTEASKQGSNRWYDDACGTALAMELVGERWSLLIVRELMFGPRRFNELKTSLNGISANVLTQRLEGLEQAGILTKHKLPPPASVQVYELTEWGLESETAIKELGRWAVRSPRHDPTLPLSAASLMMSFRTMYKGGEQGVVGFKLGAETFVAELGDDEIRIARGNPAAADVVFEGDQHAIAGVIYGGMPLGDMIGQGGVAVHGNMDFARTFITLFPLPAKLGG